MPKFRVGEILLVKKDKWLEHSGFQEYVKELGLKNDKPYRINNISDCLSSIDRSYPPCGVECFQKIDIGYGLNCYGYGANSNVLTLESKFLKHKERMLKCGS
jgi:hypothetical protein